MVWGVTGSAICHGSSQLAQSKKIADASLEPGTVLSTLRT